MPATKVRLVDPYVTEANVVVPRSDSITRTPLSAAVADCDVVQVVAAGNTSATVVVSTFTAAAASDVRKLKKATIAARDIAVIAFAAALRPWLTEPMIS